MQAGTVPVGVAVAVQVAVAMFVAVLVGVFVAVGVLVNVAVAVPPPEGVLVGVGAPLAAAKATTCITQVSAAPSGAVAL
jgi:hypothetical protein